MEPKTKILLGVSAVLILIVIVVLFVKYMKNDNNDNNDKTNSKETYEIRENFPQTSPVNILYTDQNGNLGATSDVGINNLSVFNGSNLKGGLTTDILTASTSMKSPTIDTINTTLTSLQSQINTLNTALTNLTTNFNDLNSKAMKIDTDYKLFGNSNGQQKQYYLSDGYIPRADGIGTYYGNSWFFRNNVASGIVVPSG